jgi:hypothetical protein
MKFDLSLMQLKLGVTLGPKLNPPGVLFLSFRVQHEAGQPGLYKVSTIIDSQCLQFITVVCKRAHGRHKYISFRRLVTLSSTGTFGDILQMSQINKNIVLPVVLYGCETWSLTLREDV